MIMTYADRRCLCGLFLLCFLLWTPQEDLKATSSSLSNLSKKPLVIYIRESFYKTCAPFLNQATSGKIRFVRLGSSLLMGRLRREKETLQADLVIGTDSCLTPEIMDLGVVGDHEIDPNSFHVPIPWEKQKIIPFCYGYLGFLYKGNQLPNPPETVDSILSSELKIVMSHPRTSTVGLVFTDWLKEKSTPEHLDGAPGDLPFHNGFSQNWQRFQERLLSLPKGLSQAFSLFMAGEADLMVAYTTSTEFAAVHRHDNSIRALPLKRAPFHGYTAFVTPKGALNPEAQKLLKALLRDDLQREIIQKDCLYPVAPSLQKGQIFSEKEPLPALPVSFFTRKIRQALLARVEALSKELP